MNPNQILLDENEIIIENSLPPLFLIGLFTLLILLSLLYLKNKKNHWPYHCLLRVKDYESQLMAMILIENCVKRVFLYKQEFTAEGINCKVFLQLNHDDSSFIQSLRAMSGVYHASLYHGEE